MIRNLFYYKAKEYNGYTDSYEDSAVSVYGSKIPNCKENVFLIKRNKFYEIFDTATGLLIVADKTKYGCIQKFFENIDRYHEILKQDWYMKAVKNFKSLIGGENGE